MEYFFFYFENVAMVNGPSEERARALITHSRGKAFQVDFKRFPSNGELTEDAVHYRLAKKVLKERFGNMQNSEDVVESAVSLNRNKSKDLLSFIDTASNVYEGAGFTEEQKFVFMFMVAIQIDEMRQLVVMPALKVFSTLIEAW